MEGVGECFESEVLRHAGALGNKVVRDLETVLAAKSFAGKPRSHRVCVGRRAPQIL